MAILEVKKDNNRQLQNIANTLAAAKKIVVITGAGISTSCGIPDFRSEEGLYSLIQAQRDAALANPSSDSTATRPPLSPRQPTNSRPVGQAAKYSAKHRSTPSNIKGKDLFDAQLWKDPTSTSVFYTFIAALRKTLQEDIKKATPTHRLIRTLRDKRKLVRCYTQNIDGLETREDLCTDMQRGKGNRARFTKQSLDRPRAHVRTLPGGDFDNGCEVVQLHGDLEVLRCTLCQQTCPWDEHNRSARLLAGKAPSCQSCVTTNLDRQDRGKRGTKIGTLRPNIVLYGEEHPSADAVGAITAHDLALAPDLLLVLGTSLHVHGLKVMVREFAKSVHSRAGNRGKVIFVNLSRPAESAWKDVFDYWVSMDCDAWVGALRRHRPDIFQLQDQLKLAVTKSSGSRLAKANPSPEVARESIENKENVEPERTSTPTKQRCQPSVVLPAGKLPSRATTFELLKKVRTAARGPEREDVHGKNPIDDEQSQLPTPPSTDQRVRFSTPSKRRSLGDSYQDLWSSPSKRRRTTITPSIWEDTEVEAS